VMKDGSVAERGTHEELLHRRGLYYETYCVQHEALPEDETVLCGDTGSAENKAAVLGKVESVRGKAADMNDAGESVRHEGEEA
ncbi:MAG: hypothetical protein K2N41_10330, partial [Lachnospiraceae bacterium]|nr:hypothetical protein [Lachnospiraceae bacterium]